MVTKSNILFPWVAPTEGMISLAVPKGPQSRFFENVKPMEGYEPPTSYQSIKGLDKVGLDIESYDPDLKTKGPGAHRKEGYIVGIGIGNRDNLVYYPLQHKNLSRNIQFDRFWEQLREDAKDYSGELIGANLQYDLDWLGRRHGVYFPRARIRDVQIAEPLLDENKLSYKLNSLAQQYLSQEKATGFLDTLYGPDYIENMHKVDPGHAAFYCCKDIALSMDIYEIQVPLLHQEELWDLFDLESRLIPLLLRMRENGVPVDIPKAEVALAELEKQREEVSKQITREAGCSIDVWSADSIAFAFRQNDIGYPSTANGRPSFTKDWLAAHREPLAQLINEQRAFEKIGGTFLKSYLLESHVDGRVFCQFNQLRSDSGGTVSGRFSSSYPNLQNIPTRHPVLGPLCRSIFIPEEDHDWGCTDWSQIEFRFLVHYAIKTFHDPSKHDPDAIASALAAATAYRTDPSTDFHKAAAAITQLPRKDAKAVNFGVVYGMGVPTMAANLGKSIEEAAPILDEFHTKMPFLKKIYDKTSKAAANRGYIKTILNRRRRFDVYETTAYMKGARGEKKFGPLDVVEKWMEEQREAGARVQDPRRAFTHKALNALLQGSAADLMKKSMVDIWDAGIFDIVIPHLTVHDEMDVSVPKTNEGAEAFRELTDMMATSMKLEVPVFASASTGANWSEAKGKD